MTSRRSQAELRELTDTVHRDEVARTQQRLRIEAAARPRPSRSSASTPEALVEEFGPHQLVPAVRRTPTPTRTPPRPSRCPLCASSRRSGCAPPSAPCARLARAAPLALEEFAALEERHKFLTDQLNDIKKSREDLLTIVKEIDERVELIFSEAFPRHGSPVRAHRSRDSSPAVRAGLC